ncbi:DMT family transporter [Clostridium saccharobutylicum]|uniref:DMT superfamily permease n=3 Tax=Clostridium saccharobutylicum TaxID=169679 RepID=U5MR66_CLOSA|nr:DMT family transporter [Clostridium saccharobutylicum]AGX43095.1 DMT superfamily permease [Clostridium saccharobutylicum DSM 13864]AQR90390.1 EamA-like transporter family protein [Clostridium saccharobutylicum]AQS00296.1 EamA-like transporter family protein [Clostridium saccharobutylicum]AQS14279.1 EamA-like transporter family protein [Clostridium saccharobutylicum]MBA2907040.1 drug/metabolite transporter (DMT)-like permease [Clostridium saccharobutylicum]
MFKFDAEKIFTNKKYIIILAILCTFLWGSAYPAIKLGYDVLGIHSDDSYLKLIFAGYRFLIAGIILITIQKLMGKSIMPKSIGDFKGFMLLGFVYTLMQYVFLYIGMANTTGVKSSILGSLSSFINIFLVHFIYKDDKLSVKKVTGCMIGFLSIIVLNFQAGTINGAFKLMGDGLLILSALMGSIGSIYNKNLVKNNDVFVTTGYQLIFGSLMLIIIGKSAGGNLSVLSAESGILLLYMALLSSVALVIWSMLYKYNKVGNITMYNLLTPIFGTILSAFLLGESILEVKSLIALALACTGIWIVNYK